MATYSRLAVVIFLTGMVAVSLAIRGVSAQSDQAKPAGAAPISSPSSGSKMTEDVFKNIQVLKSVPADQLIPAMQFISVSLGVECDHCHVQGAFEKDDKKPKQTARTMMQMMFAINKDNFAGHREVTCYSCHRGATDPLTVPLIAEAETKPMMPPAEAAKKPAPPTADEILDKYVKAIGGADALKKVSSRVEKGTATIFGGRKVPVEVFAKAPDKRAAVMHVPGGDSTTAYDGHVGWMGMPRRPTREVSGGDLDGLKLDADLSFPADLKEIFSSLKVEGPETVGTHPAYVIVARHGEGQPPLKLYFDEQSGLLLRQLRYVETPLGLFPTQIDDDDYRDSGGVKVPFQWTIARPGNRFTMQMESAETNVPIDDAKFAKPPTPPAEEKPPAK